MNCVVVERSRTRARHFKFLLFFRVVLMEEKEGEGCQHLIYPISPKANTNNDVGSYHCLISETAVPIQSHHRLGPNSIKSHDCQEKQLSLAQFRQFTKLGNWQLSTGIL